MFTGLEERFPIKNALLDLLVPLSKAGLFMVREIKNAGENLFALRDVFQENLKLRTQIRELLREQQRFKKVLNENERLKELLGYAAQFPHRTLSAKVIGYDPSNWFTTIRINRGRRDRVCANQVVIGYQETREGLVGRIDSVSETWSDVLLILSQNSALGAKILRTQFKGVLEGGNSRLCQLKYIPYDADIRIGDTIITSSSIGSIFPEEFPIGEVVKIEREKGGLFLEARVRPFIEFSKLEDVLIIIEEPR